MANETMSVSETAEHEFEAWQPGEGLTPEMVRQGAATHITNACAALNLMYQSKAKLTAMADEDQDQLIDMVRVLYESAEAFEDIVRIMKAAAGRVLVAAAASVEAAGNE